MGTDKRWLNPLDAMFLWGESNETMMHVASLMPFTPPEGAGQDFISQLYDDVCNAPVASPWNLRLTHPHMLRHPRQAWKVDDRFDIDYHVRRSALPHPGDERELGIVVSRLHSHQLDFTRPPWEVHLIEGLEGGRFALYTKVHHSLVDGYSAVRIQAKSMSKDPSDRDMPFFFSVSPSGPRKRTTPEEEPERVSLPTRAVRTATAPARAAVRLGGTLASAGLGTAKAVAGVELGSRAEGSELVAPGQAPRTILNARCGRNRRLATQQVELDRIRAVAKAAGGTVNDVVMAMCGGALRRYLLELDELPRKPLVAFLPVNIRPSGDTGGGNRVGATLASLATDREDARERLEAVISSTTSAKGQMTDLSQLGVLAYSGYLLGPGGLQVLSAMTGTSLPVPTSFNLCISNLPGPQTTHYLRGARLEAIYPMSIPVHGMALNITVESYDGHLDFGFIGCRDAVPSLQRVAVYAGDELELLEEAYAVG
jgi:WS/DGAT/MGAT family acyltransferase